MLRLFPLYAQVVRTGVHQPYADISVFNAGTGTLSTIYELDGVTLKANPFDADSNGLIAFKAEAAEYDIDVDVPTNPIHVTLPGFQAYSYGKVPVGLAQISDTTRGLLTSTLAGLPSVLAGRIRLLTDSVRGIWYSTELQWLSANGRIVNVQDFGAVGDGSTDDTAAIQAASDAAGANSIVYFPTPAIRYRLTGLVTVTHNNQTWRGANSQLYWSTLGATTLGSAGAGTAGVRADANYFWLDHLSLEGPSSGVYVSNEALVVMCGVDNSPSGRRYGLKITDCEITESGSYGIFTEFVDDIWEERNYAHDIGYAGFLHASSNHGRFVRNRVKTITPGTSFNAYGITLTHRSTDYNILPGAGTKAATYPFCWDWVIGDNYVEDVLWQGIDTHGGYEIVVRDNRVYNCTLGIAVAGGSGDATDYAGWDNQILGNLVDASNEDGTASGRENLGAGIETTASGTMPHRRVIVANNIVKGYGIVNATTVGAIRSYNNFPYVCANNHITSWGGFGIVVDAKDNRVTGNVIGKLADPGTETVGAAIFCESPSGRLTVTDNTLSAEDGTAAKTGFKYASLLTPPVISGNDFRAATVGAITPPAPGAQLGPDYPNILRYDINTTPTTIDISGFQPGIPGIIKFITSAPVTITNLTGAGSEGQVIILVNTTVNNVTFTRSNAQLVGSVDWVGTRHQTLVLMLMDGSWHQIGGFTNIG